ncbi:hypothetical protein BU24DRAFT_98581 [Aaosphaeria arxii CBS 175.79]|uniref:Uncharacterized protein n=1 Tax=Aaosphaeria arxii CBS 175.79 TaxID=1450172 RepID=A0A6A5X673_9PLEO|nr:uncharacterized protein BU24DRAFT_98581 [Aaosphaeria arxii CBS 175.79]KAF2008371.1 hypothetical protein BU24DRAFT_98581 [Aaosphaeria arxii CBS 175.79]
MYRFLPYPHVAIALLLSLPTILKAQKPLVECPKLLYWDLAEANVSHKIPALKLNGLNMERDGDRQWELHFRTSLGPSTSTYFLDTADSNMTNIGLCSGGLRLMDRNTWQLSKGVIERSLKDNGDCKIMLGEACTEALRQHYEREARMAYMIHGRCLQCEEEPCSIEPSATNAGTPWNDTVPYQCSGLVDGRQEWVSGAGSLWMDGKLISVSPLFHTVLFYTVHRETVAY